MDNKEYILNIRVSKDTYEKLKKKAKENGETLSNLVRKTMSDSYEIFKDLKRDIFDNDKTNNILHYQRVMTATEMTCSNCKSKIEKGANVYMGETKTGSKKYFCNNCFTNNSN